MAENAKIRARDRIAELSTRGLDAVTFYQEAAEALTSAVPTRHELNMWHTLDPASLLITSSKMGPLTETPQEVLEWEYLQDDHVKKIVDVARTERGMLSLYEATGGDPSSSRYLWSVLQRRDLTNMLQVTLRARGGTVWGDMVLMRGPEHPDFDHHDRDFLATVTPLLAEGIRMGLLVGEATDPETPAAPGLLVLDDDWRIDSATPGVEAWLADLPGGASQDGKLPPAVIAVAGRALQAASGSPAAGNVAVSRVRSRTGRWVFLHGAALISEDRRRRAAVIIEPAQPARITSLLMAAYGLTPREQDITRRVLSGDSTAQIAATLFVSPHTVQQHLKSIFEKTGVHSRRDLVGKVFFSHYEPRVRDNEQRVTADRPIRGGPYPYETAP